MRSQKHTEDKKKRYILLVKALAIDRTEIVSGCRNLPIIQNGWIDLVDSSNTFYGATANVTCDEGYNSTVDIISCLSDGSWETVACEIIGNEPVFGLIEIFLSEFELCKKYLLLLLNLFSCFCVQVYLCNDEE